MLAAIRGYQLVISHHFAGSCRFLPSCSEYAREAIETHGVIRGGSFALRRLARCHPLCAGGHDPVPQQGKPGRREDHEELLSREHAVAGGSGSGPSTERTIVRANVERRQARKHWSWGWGSTTK